MQSPIAVTPTSQRLPFDTSSDEEDSGNVSNDDDGDDLDDEYGPVGMGSFEALPVPLGGRTGSLPLPSTKRRSGGGPLPPSQRPDLVAEGLTAKPPTTGPLRVAAVPWDRRPAPLIIPAGRQSHYMPTNERLVRATWHRVCIRQDIVRLTWMQ